MKLCSISFNLLNCSEAMDLVIIGVPSMFIKNFAPR